MNKQHIVDIKVSSVDWERALNNCEWDELPPTPDCKVPLIRLYKAIKDCSLREAKEAVETSLTGPKYGRYKFLLNDAEVGRLYVFLRQGNELFGQGSVYDGVQRPDRITGFEVVGLESDRGGIFS